MLCDLALGMKALGHDVGVVSLIRPRCHLERLTAGGVRVLCLDLDRNQKDLLSLLRAALKFRRHISAISPDIVHAHMVHANLFSRVALAFTGRNLICTIHNTFEGGRLRDFGYRLTNWASTLNTTISESARKAVIDRRVVPAEQTVTLYNGINMARFTPAAPRTSAEPFRWIAVGRLEEQKDYPTLLRAMRRVPGAQIDIAGKGVERQKLDHLAVELGVADRVRFLGVRSDIPKLLRAYDGYVLSSAWEGFGIALVEAMASGLPVVATDSGGPSEIIGTDGSCGLLVPPGDEIALADAMKAIQALPYDDRTRMSHAARGRVADLFELKAILQQWSRIYEALSSNGSSSSH